MKSTAVASTTECWRITMADIAVTVTAVVAAANTNAKT